MLTQDEETLELRETFTTLQQEVEAKTKKLKKVKEQRGFTQIHRNDTQYTHVQKHTHTQTVPVLDPNVSISLFQP